MLANGCSHNQMEAIDNLLSSLEDEFMRLHLQVHGLRSVAHCGPQSLETFEKLADSTLRYSSALLQALRYQRDSVAGLLGKRGEVESG
jgi:hypothetical protein